jgi:nucleotide-binding universal stress UspA family protein
MYGNVIVGVDGQQGGRDAAALAAAIANDGAFVTLVYVGVTAPMPNHASNLDIELADDESVRALLEHELDLCGTDARLSRVVASSIGAGLEQAAEQHGADLIVVGSCRRHGIARVVSGDDVRSVMHHTPCAVAVAPASYADEPGPLTRVGVAFDGSPESEVALAHAGLLAGELHAELAPRHVVEPHYYTSGFSTMAVPVDDPELALAAARERSGEADGLEVEQVYGLVHEELVSFGDHVDLLVCGSRRNGPVRRIALGSTSDYLARHLSIPLLVAPTIDAASVGRWRDQRRGAVV